MPYGFESGRVCEVITHVQGRTIGRPVLVLRHDGTLYHAWCGRLSTELQCRDSEGLFVHLNPYIGWDFSDTDKLSNGVVLNAGKGLPTIPPELHIICPRPIDIDEGEVRPDQVGLGLPSFGQAKVIIGKRLVTPWVLKYLSPSVIRELQFRKII